MYIVDLLISDCVLQDYDWRQYASRDEGSHDEMSLRTRLTAVQPAQQNAGVDMDNSLTGSTSMVSLTS